MWVGGRKLVGVAALFISIFFLLHKNPTISANSLCLSAHHGFLQLHSPSTQNPTTRRTNFRFPRRKHLRFVHKTAFAPLHSYNLPFSLHFSPFFPSPYPPKALFPSHSSTPIKPQNSLPNILPNIPSPPSLLPFPPPPPPHKPHLKSTNFSSSTLQNPLFGRSRLSGDPTNPSGLRRASVLWFRNDLRVHDNETLNSANDESLSVLPGYCFDPRDYGKSSSGFDKTGPYRATFLIESVSDLRKKLQSRGSDLIVRIGKPENVLLELAKAVGSEAVYVHREVSSEEVKGEEKIEGVMKEEGIEVKYFWGSTLYHIDDLPFTSQGMPSNYGGFKKGIKGLEMRKTIQALDQLRGLPARGDIDPGEIPTLLDLGLSPNSALPQDGKPTANASLVGGETEALHRLQSFAAELRGQPNHSTQDNIYGANFSCKISPWLALGCLSPRFMFGELKKSASRMIPSAQAYKNGAGKSDNGLNWLMYELLWRYFFRFITKRYSSTKKKLNGVPVTARTGALA